MSAIWRGAGERHRAEVPDPAAGPGQVVIAVQNPVVGQTFALRDAAQAHAAIERRATVGKTQLRVA